MQETQLQSVSQEISLGKGNGNPLQYSCLENPMDRGAWQATVHRVTKSQTQRKQLSTHVSPTDTLQVSTTNALETSCSEKPKCIWRMHVMFIKILLKSKRQILKTVILNMSLHQKNPESRPSKLQAPICKPAAPRRTSLSRCSTVVLSGNVIYLTMDNGFSEQPQGSQKAKVSSYDNSIIILELK